MSCIAYGRFTCRSQALICCLVLKSSMNEKRLCSGLRWSTATYQRDVLNLTFHRMLWHWGIKRFMYTFILAILYFEHSWIVRPLSTMLWRSTYRFCLFPALLTSRLATFLSKVLWAFKLVFYCWGAFSNYTFSFQWYPRCQSGPFCHN